MRKLGYLTILLASVFFITIVFTSSIKNSTIGPDFKVRIFINSILPQGWGFFTRNPREDMVDIYAIEKEKPQKLTIRNSELSNSLGISRRSRKIDMEVSIIREQIPDSLWHKNSNLEKIILPENTDIKLSRRNLHFIKNGDYVMVKRKTIPWAWIGKAKNNIPYKVVRVEIVDKIE